MRQIIILLYRIKLLKRLIPSILKLFIKIKRNYKTVIVHKNFQLNLNLKNPIDREIYLKDKYETEQIHYLERLIIKDHLNIFIDIGSHMGFYSMNLQSKVNDPKDSNNMIPLIITGVIIVILLIIIVFLAMKK